jgi:hypothetical protein
MVTSISFTSPALAQPKISPPLGCRFVALFGMDALRGRSVQTAGHALKTFLLAAMQDRGGCHLPCVWKAVSLFRCSDFSSMEQEGCWLDTGDFFRIQKIKTDKGATHAAGQLCFCPTSPAR